MTEKLNKKLENGEVIIGAYIFGGFPMMTEAISLCGFTITPVPSAHEVFHTDEQGNYRELGYILDNKKARFFHAGDRCMYDGLLPRLKNIDLAILPINGRDYFRNENDIERIEGGCYQWHRLPKT